MKPYLILTFLLFSFWLQAQDNRYKTIREVYAEQVYSTNIFVQGSGFIQYHKDHTIAYLGIADRTTAGTGGTLVLFAQDGMSEADASRDGGDVYIYGGADDGNVILSPYYGSVGIRVESPKANLHLNGTFRIDSPQAYFEFSTIAGGDKLPDTLLIEYNGVIMARIPPRQ